MSRRPSLQLPLDVRWLRAPDFSSFAPDQYAEAVAATRLASLEVDAPLFLHGPAGSGKTHLLQAAARSAHERRRRAGYLPLRQDPAAVEGYECLDFIAVDGCEAAAGHPQLAVALARLIDAARSRGASLVLASRLGPGHLQHAISPDLCTRLLACQIYALGPLSDAGLRDALQRQAQARGLTLAVDVADYLIRRLPRDMPSMIRLLDQLDNASLSAQHRLTIPFVQRHLQLLAESDAAHAPSSEQTKSN